MLSHIRRVRREVVFGLMVLLSIFALGGCLYLQPRKAADIDNLKEDVTRIERFCAENDKKVAEIYSHLYMLQVKVYSSENEINALKTQLTPHVPPEEPAPAEKAEKAPPPPDPKPSPVPV